MLLKILELKRFELISGRINIVAVRVGISNHLACVGVKVLATQSCHTKLFCRTELLLISYENVLHCNLFLDSRILF